MRFDRRERVARRESILGAMLEVVGEVGYEEATLGMVLGRSGLSARAFELEFEGKEDCYLAAFDFGVERVESVVAAASAERGSWADRFSAGLAALLEFLDAEPELARALLVEVRFAGPEAQGKWMEAMRRAAQFVDLARLEDSEVEAPAEIAASMVVGGIYGRLRVQLDRVAGSGVRTRGELVELLPGLVYFAMLPYFGEEAARREMVVARMPRE